MPALKKIGAACLAAFGWTTGANAVTASYLVVAGGGGGGNTYNTPSADNAGGGGGAGGYQTGTTSLTLTQSYTVIVGAGGAGSTGAAGGNGSNSQFGTLTASVGGGGGGTYYTVPGQNGGSGGGGPGSPLVSPPGAGTGTAGQGNNGGVGGNTVGIGNGGGGGGGAGAVGSNGSGATAGNGGVGLASSISGASTYYAGGGGGGTYTGGTPGTGGNGGGGSGAASGGTTGAGTANTGGGGGGIGGGNAGKGGSGVVIISYSGAQQFGGGTVTSVGGNTIHTFNTSGTLSPLNSLTASYLIVAGGGGGGHTIGGGGGAGGLKAGSALTIDTNSTYLVTVGAGGAGSTSASVAGSSGSNSSFSLVSTAMVGGGGGGSNSGPTAPTSGGSGGGAAGAGTGGTGASGTAGQGNSGGNSPASSPYPSGGGGGSSAAGATGSGTASGAGGAGTASSISGTSSYYAGGGGGGASSNFGTNPGAGGSSVGGAGAQTTNGFDGVINTGSGGGGGGSTNIQGYSGGAGASGVVIISYPGSTQQMAGGSVTIVGGNVIHTFTSSGYLTPLTFVGNSLRFRSGASASLTRTYGTPTNSKIWTWSGWIKRGKLGANQEILNGNSSNSQFYFTSSDTLYFYDATSGADYNTTQVFRDPAAWYHIVVAMDTTQATAGNRVKIYINGSQVTAFGTSTAPTQNNNSAFNVASTLFALGVYYPTPSNYFDGYMANVQFIDGQALAPTAFGTFNSYGVWQPITYGGSYGTNGFYLPFTNTASTTTLGYDFSPQGNNWTCNNISLTAGSTYDSMTDVPTLTSTTAANYAVLNPLSKGSDVSITNGNLTYSLTGSTNCNMYSSIGMTTGKFYCEVTITGNQYSLLGISDANVPAGNGFYQQSRGYGYYGSNGNKYNTGSASAYGATFTAGDVIGIAFDADAGTLTFYKNNTSQGTAFTSIPAGTYFFCEGNVSNLPQGSFNFGQQPFVYTPPSGYVALNTYNL